MVTDANVAESDPKFVDPARMNFQIKDGSPAYGMGFKRVPVEKMGLYRDEFRTTLPQPKRDWNDFVPLADRPKPKPAAKKGK